MNLGYQLASEEHGPNVLVENRRRAEEAGFAYGVVSDHFHPWIDAQGQSPYVWSVLSLRPHERASAPRSALSPPAPPAGAAVPPALRTPGPHVSARYGLAEAALPSTRRWPGGSAAASWSIRAADLCEPPRGRPRVREIGTPPHRLWGDASPGEPVARRA